MPPKEQAVPASKAAKAEQKPFAQQAEEALAATHTRVHARSDGNCLLNSFYLHMAAVYNQHNEFKGFDSEQVNKLLHAIFDAHPRLRAKCPRNPATAAVAASSHCVVLDAENNRMYQQFLAFFRDWDSRQVAMAKALRKQVADSIKEKPPSAETLVLDEVCQDVEKSSEDGYHLGYMAIGHLCNLYGVEIKATTGQVADSDNFIPQRIDGRYASDEHAVQFAVINLLSTHPEGGFGGHFDLLLPKAEFRAAEQFATNVANPAPQQTITHLYQRGKAVSARFIEKFATEDGEIEYKVSENARVNNYVADLVAHFDRENPTNAHFTNGDAGDYGLALRLQMEELEGYLADDARKTAAKSSPRR